MGSHAGASLPEPTESYKKSGVWAKGHSLTISLPLSLSWPPSAFNHIHIQYSPPHLSLRETAINICITVTMLRGWHKVVWLNQSLNITSYSVLDKLKWPKNLWKIQWRCVCCFLSCLVLIVLSYCPSYVAFIHWGILIDGCGCLSFRLCIQHIKWNGTRFILGVFSFKKEENGGPTVVYSLLCHWYNTLSDSQLFVYEHGGKCYLWFH